jgi:outer membrane lipoprotein-sorting protein
VLRLGLLVLLLVVAFGPFGCSPPPRPAAPAAPLRLATLEEIRAAYDGYCNGIETLSASGDLDVRDARTGKTQRLGVRLVAARGGRLYLKGSVAVVTALEVVSNGDRFWFQVPSKKTVWTGSSNSSAESERSEAPYYALRPSDIALAFLPEPLTPGAGEALVLESDRQSFSLALVSAAGGTGVARRRVWLERASLAWIRSRSFDEKGELRSEVGLAGWAQGRPRQVVISRPGDGYVAAFALDELDANVPVPERAFQPRTPQGYKVVEVR